MSYSPRAPVFSRYVFFCCLLLVAVNCNALPGAADHAELWLYCIGTTDTHPSRSKFIELSSLIDIGLKDDIVRTGLQRLVPDIMKKLPANFKFGIEGGMVHRRVFHWGLSSEPDDLAHASAATPLRKLLELRISKADTLTEMEKDQLKKAFYRVIGDEWKNRRDDFSNNIQRIFGKDVSPTAGGIPPIAIVIYEIHIIADYMDKMSTDLGEFDLHFNEEFIAKGLKAIPNSDSLVRTLKQAYNRQPPISAKELNELAAEAPDRVQNLFYKSSGSMEDETRRRAMHLLLILRKQLPAVLEKSYPNSMKNLGVIANQDNSSKKWWSFW